jgi:hypothetical protein
MDYESEILRLKALSILQSGDISSLLSLIQSVARDADLDRDLNQDFLRMRKQIVQAMLEKTEDKNPELAAALQDLIDSSCNIFPFDYE